MVLQVLFSQMRIALAIQSSLDAMNLENFPDVSERDLGGKEKYVVASMDIIVLAYSIYVLPSVH